MTACADTRQPSVGGRYESAEITPGQWRMTYRAVPRESRDSIQASWLYHSAVFTREQGFDGFVVIGRVMLSAVQDDDPLFHRTAVIDILTPSDRAWGRSLTGTIALVRKPYAPPPARTFDAIEVMRELERRLSDD